MLVLHLQLLLPQSGQTKPIITAINQMLNVFQTWLSYTPIHLMNVSLPVSIPVVSSMIKKSSCHINEKSQVSDFVSYTHQKLIL